MGPSGLPTGQDSVSRAPTTAEVFAVLDEDGDGNVDLVELQAAAKAIKDAKSCPKGKIPLSSFPKDAQPMVQVFDNDGDNTVDTSELMAGAALYKSAKNETKRMTKIVGGLVLVILVMVGAMTGLMVVVIEATKETKADSDGKMMVAGSNKPATVENPHFKVKNSTADSEEDSSDMVDANGNMINVAVKSESRSIFDVPTSWQRMDALARGSVNYHMDGTQDERYGKFVQASTRICDVVLITETSMKLFGCSGSEIFLDAQTKTGNVILPNGKQFPIYDKLPESAAPANGRRLGFWWERSSSYSAPATCSRGMPGAKWSGHHYWGCT